MELKIYKPEELTSGLISRRNIIVFDESVSWGKVMREYLSTKRIDENPILVDVGVYQGIIEKGGLLRLVKKMESLESYANCVEILCDADDSYDNKIAIKVLENIRPKKGFWDTGEMVVFRVKYKIDEKIKKYALKNYPEYLWYLRLS